ncbi:hypothetical protein EWM64_g1113 [Hericium alpestre]|uniref:Uncharacterized protein n=1 Tax=Hericium alpestre TaxID=135208 RepID=A0A4Z0A8N5_9AGAM|nr:hypothetical protein EWM64_g1113 [Hericium alpestre]
MVGEDNGLALTALITSAAHDEKPERNLREIYQTIITDGREADLDALDVLLRLLPCQLDGAEDLLSLVGERGSAKEILIAGQEAAERMEAALGQEEEPEAGQLPFSSQLSRLMSLYTSAAKIGV